MMWGPGAGGAAGGAPGGGQPGQGTGMVPVTPAQEQTAKDFLRDWDPDRLREIERIQMMTPTAYPEVIRNIVRQMYEVQEIKEKDPGQYKTMTEERELNRKVRDQVKVYRQTTDPKQKEARGAELNKLIGQQFDLKLTLQERRIKELEEKVAKLKATLQKRRSGKEDMVKRRFRQVSGEEEEMDW